MLAAWARGCQRFYGELYYVVDGQDNIDDTSGTRGVL